MQAKVTPLKAIGFTLVELVVVIIILGTLSLAVAPRLLDRQSVAAQAYQARLISVLRTMQMRAMYDARPDCYYQVNVWLGSDSRFGPPIADYVNCSGSDLRQLDTSVEHLVATKAQMQQDQVTITAAPGYIRFNQLGCPVNGGVCTAQQITLQGQTQVKVCIESEGYIHAC